LVNSRCIATTPISSGDGWWSERTMDARVARGVNPISTACASVISTIQ
jgi:hypothetical protein